MLFDGSGRHFRSEVQQPASKKVLKLYLSDHNLRQGCQIIDNDVSLDRFIQYLCNEVLFDGSGNHFHSEIQHPAPQNCIKITL